MKSWGMALIEVSKFKYAAKLEIVSKLRLHPQFFLCYVLAFRTF